MNHLPHILAQEDSSLPKIIFGLIFFIIWALSALVSWLNKQQQQAKRQRVREELERASRYNQAPPPRQQPSRQPPAPPPPVRRPAPQRISEGIAQRFPDVMLPPAPPPVPRPQQQRRPMPPRPLPPPLPVRRTPPRQAQLRRQAPPPPLPTLEEIAPPEAYVNITQPAPRPKPPTVDAERVRQWLTPATLRHQFILTEILQPPLAIRPAQPDRT